jgi:hypothetical protein
MSLDRIKEQIKFNTEIIRLIIVLMIATGGSALTLIITGLRHARETILAAAGMIVAVVCWVVTVKVYKITQDLIKKL